MTDNSGGGSEGSFLDGLNPARMVQSLFVETDFESRSHEEMLKMIEAADPGVTRRLGDKLVNAATEIDKIGQALKTHAPRVAWEGEGADAFTGWSDRMSSATLRLGTMSKSAGEAMRNAADTLQEVQRDMPPYAASARMTLNDYIMQNPGGLAKLEAGPRPSPSPSGGAPGSGGPTASEAYSAQQQLDEAHGEAARQMRKLAQSYTLTGMTVNGAERPTFPPMPGELMPPPVSVEGVDGSTYLGSESAPQETGGFAAHKGVDGPRGSGVVSDRAPQADSPGMTLDGGVAVPEAPQRPAPQMPTSTGPSGPGPVSPVPGPAAPNVPQQTPKSPPGAPRTAPPPEGRSPVTGRPATPHADGRQPGPTAPRPPVGRVPADNGIHGGRPTQPGTGQPTHGIPRGRVIGAEPAQGQQSRPSMGARPVGGGFGGAGGPSQGIVGGRPLASQPGGRVGAPQSTGGISGGRPFTPGGSGLVRGGVASGADDPATRGTTARPPASRTFPEGERQEGSRRPDYLVEDEETWQPGDRARVAPPVVE